MKHDFSDLECLSENELKNRLERGDFVEPSEIIEVNFLLNKYKREREFIEKCERATKSAAYVSQRRSLVANIVSSLAVVISIVNLVWLIWFTN